MYLRLHLSVMYNTDIYHRSNMYACFIGIWLAAICLSKTIYATIATMPNCWSGG